MIVSFIVQLIGLYLFKTGYLLSRLELETISETDRLKTPTFKKTLLVVVDALRFDFMKPVPDDKNLHYLNKLSIIKDKLLNEPQNSLLFRGMSDPPTTTLQRLIAITTGALPTLVDAGSNFASSALKEDNLIQKIQDRGDVIISMGDDTWDRLYPSMMNESYYFPSFDVWDLDTVDNGVKSNLFPLLMNKTKQWNFVIAHFLGVDHAGHRYGPGHVAMGDKLMEMDRVFERIFELIDNDTLVVIMGDHGMDRKGDHGGDSMEEMDAALFFYSKKNLYPKEADPFVKRILQETLNIPEYETFSVFDGSRTVQQIDLVSTLSFLLGLEIPFGNLGMVIPELTATGGIKNIVESIKHNAYQVHTYLNVYSSKRSDAKVAFAKSADLYEEATKTYNDVVDWNDEDKLLQVYMEYLKYLRHTLVVARKIWSRFEHSLMIMGTILLVLASFDMILSVVLNTKDQFYKHLPYGLGGMVGFLSPISQYCYPNESTDSLTIKPIHEFAFFSTLIFITLRLLNHISFKSNYTTMFTKIESETLISSLILVGLYIGSIGSDSFLIFEDFLLLHFVQFIHAIHLFRLVYQNQVDTKDFKVTIMKMILTRIISMITICRPDQGPYCVPSFYSSPTSSIAAAWMPSLTISAAIIATILNDKLKTIPPKAIVGYTISMFSSVGYWALDTWQNHGYLANTDNLKTVLLGFFWASLAWNLYSRSMTRSQQTFLFLLLFQKPGGQFTLTLFHIYIELNRYIGGDDSTLFFMGQLLFFTTGHQNQLPSIQYDVGFIGLSKADFVISPTYVTFNTFAGPLLGSISCSNRQKHLVFMALVFTFSVFFCGWFSRHSQAFRVWGPKFLFATGSHLVCSLGLLFIGNDTVELKSKSE